MKYTIRKLFLVWQHEEEERWLNEMSAKGLQLRDVGLCKYKFEEGLPGEYVYRIEYLEDAPKTALGAQYVSFVEDTGAEYVDSWQKWAYFRKKADTGGFDLFSDIESRIKHFDRILALTGVVSAVNLINAGLQFVLFVLLKDREGGTIGGKVSPNLITGIVCAVVCALLGVGFLRLYQKRRKLKKEKLLRE
jgi:hypothetical protein